MPFVFDATPGGPAANSWATPDEADDYFGGRLHTAAWSALTLAEKQRALADGTHDLEQCDYNGSLASTTQRLRLPRHGLFDVDGRALGSLTVPRVFKEALYEHVLFKLGQARDTHQPSGLEAFASVDVPGAIAVTLRGGAAAPTFSSKALAMLSPYLRAVPGTTRLARAG